MMRNENIPYPDAIAFLLILVINVPAASAEVYSVNGFPFVPTFDPFMSDAQIDGIDNDVIAEFIPGSSDGKLYTWDIIKHISADNAGNREKLMAARIRIDKTPPLSYFEPGDKWYRTAITANITASDDLSDVASIFYTIDGSLPYVSYSTFASINLSTEGIHTIEYSSMDNANNAEHVKNAFVKLDFTPPVVSIGRPASGNYLHSDITVLNFSGTDGLSGITFLKAAIDGIRVENAQKFDMLSLPAGDHKFSVQASDAAGNTAAGSVSFRVVSNIDSMIGLTERALREGWITSEDTARSLTSKLNSAKQKIMAGQKEKANNIIKAYIIEVEAHAGKTITPEGARILTTEAAYAYITNFS